MTENLYDAILAAHSWIAETGQRYILSPDSDGFLCGLFMTSRLKGEVSGYYDGKILLLKKGLCPEQCIFLDMDINRPNIRSIGHHMVLYNKKCIPPNFTYQNCIQPNLLRNFDGVSDFQRKYPFGTSHLLLGILQRAGVLQSLPKEAIWPLMFTDGTWNNLFGYTENCLEWLDYLQISNPDHILHYHFCDNHHTVYTIMNGLNDFLRLRDSFNAVGYYREGVYRKGGKNKRTGDKLRISDSGGNIINVVSEGSCWKIHDLEKRRILGFIERIAEYMKMKFHESQWQWEGFALLEMQKNDFKGLGSRLNNRTYIELMEKNPFSLAISSRDNIEYTLFPSNRKQ